MSTPYSPPRYRRNSNLQLALAVKRGLEIIFQSAIVLTKLCERHDAIGSNLPIIKTIKTAWDSGKRHQVSVLICDAHAWHVASRNFQSIVSQTRQAIGSDIRTAGSKEWRTDTFATDKCSPLNNRTQYHIKCLLNLTSMLTDTYRTQHHI